MAKSVFVAPTVEKSLAEIRRELAAEKPEASNAELAQAGLDAGSLIVPEGKTIKNLAEAIRKASKVAVTPTAAPEGWDSVETSTPEAAAPVEKHTAAAPVERVNGRWVCADCGQVSRKLARLPHARTCVNHQTPVH